MSSKTIFTVAITMLFCQGVRAEVIQSAVIITSNCKPALEMFAKQNSVARILPLAVKVEHAPQIENILLLEGEPEPYLKARNDLNKLLNKCEANSFTRFKLSENVSQSIIDELSKSGALVRVEDGYLYLYKVRQR